MNFIKLSSIQIEALRGFRKLSDKERKSRKAAFFRDVRGTYGIPTHIKLRVNVDSDNETSFGYLRDAGTDQYLKATPGGQYDGVHPSGTNPNSGTKKGKTAVVTAVEVATSKVFEVDVSDVIPEILASIDDTKVRASNVKMPEGVDNMLNVTTGILYFTK